MGGQHAARMIVPMTYYIHNLDPVIVHLYGPLSVRWYGVSYLLAFLATYGLWRILSTKGKLEIPKEEIGNFVVSVGVFGVLLGGRLGYVFFYGLADWVQDPLFIVKLWEGGMASHGGMVGIAVYVWWYARQHGCGYWGLVDNLACAAPLGLCFGRIANFINGELWGKVSEVPWAVIFPQELGWTGDASASKGDILRMVESGVLQPRHPSQLYEAFGEGLLLFGILWWLRMKPWSNQPGRLAVLFLVLYGLVRFVVEFYREPDSTIYFGWMSKGQLLSLGMIVVALVLVALFRVGVIRAGTSDTSGKE